MNLEELFYFMIGLLIIYGVYWQIFGINEHVHDGEKRQSIIFEPNKLLVNYAEAVGMIYGDEEE